jgi:hypothetical protein
MRCLYLGKLLSLSLEGIRFMVEELERQISESENAYTRRLLKSMKNGFPSK